MNLRTTTPRSLLTVLTRHSSSHVGRTPSLQHSRLQQRRFQSGTAVNDDGVDVEEETPEVESVQPRGVDVGRINTLFQLMHDSQHPRSQCAIPLDSASLDSGKGALDNLSKKCWDNSDWGKDGTYLSQFAHQKYILIHVHDRA